MMKSLASFLCLLNAGQADIRWERDQPPQHGATTLSYKLRDVLTHDNYGPWKFTLLARDVNSDTFKQIGETWILWTRPATADFISSPDALFRWNGQCVQGRFNGCDGNGFCGSGGQKITGTLIVDLKKLKLSGYDNIAAAQIKVRFHDKESESFTEPSRLRANEFGPAILIKNNKVNTGETSGSAWRNAFGMSIILVVSLGAL